MPQMPQFRKFGAMNDTNQAAALVEHECEFRFYAELNDFLTLPHAWAAFTYRFHGTPTVKDAIEALGVPHTEVDLVLVNGTSVNFAYRLRPGNRVAVYPVFETLNIAEVTHLRPKPLRTPCFICDVHLGKLARRLRLLGFDVTYSNAATDPEIVAAAIAEHTGLSSPVTPRDLEAAGRDARIPGSFRSANDPSPRGVGSLRSPRSGQPVDSLRALQWSGHCRGQDRD